jgi:hypothetical protein
MAEFFKNSHWTKMLVLIFFTIFSETFLIQRRNEGDIIINMLKYSCTTSVIFVRFERILNILDKVSKNTAITNLMKIRPVGLLFHADRYNEANSHLAKFVKLPKNTQLTRQICRR